MVALKLDKEFLSYEKPVKSYDVVAVIPAYNEERFIASVVIKAQKHADLIIVVDDGSSDHTTELAEFAGALVIKQPLNMGKARALNVGFARAKEFNPKAVVCIDADCQHDPVEIPKVARPILEKKADVVIGSRFLETKSDIPAWRQVGQHTLTVLTNVLSGTNVTDSQSGFRAFSPKALDTLKLRTAGLSVESEMQFLFKPARLMLAEVPISVQYRDGNKRNPVSHGLQILDSLFSLVARRRPLLFFTIPGMAFNILGIIVGVVVTYRFQQTHSLSTGLAILVAILINLGLILSITGILLHNISHLTDRFKEELHDMLSNYTVST